MRMWIAIASVVVGLGVLGSAAGLALATPGSAQYDSTTVTTTVPGTTTDTNTGTNEVLGGGTKVNNSTPAASSPAPTVKSGNLPFTGASLVWIAAAGALLVLLGLALRRRGRRSSTS